MKTLNKIMMIIGISGLAALTSGSSFASGQNEEQAAVKTVPVAKESKSGGVTGRVERQNNRIKRKLAKGKMTVEQAQAEKGKIANIEAEREAMKKENGGKKLTRQQRKKLNSELNKTSAEIKNAGKK